MPCLLKRRSGSSPGIITFTHNETLFGVIKKSSRVRSHLLKISAAREWLFGVHIQGDVSWLGSWPLEEWQSFIMWPDETAKVLANVPRERKLPLNCISFMPDIPVVTDVEKLWDICIVTRASPIKRPIDSLMIVKRLLELRETFRAVIVAPDPRKIELGERTYEADGIERRFFELPRQLFSCSELKRISFLCSSEAAFGRFPMSSDLLNLLLQRSKFTMLTSHSEGTPRSVAESLLNNVPCILSEALQCGILPMLEVGNCLRIPVDIEAAAQMVARAVDDYRKCRIDAEKVRAAFASGNNLPILRKHLSDLIASRNQPIEGNWYLDELHLRLACHGQKYNGQLMEGEDAFFRWLERVQAIDPYDEDALFSS